MRFAAINLQFPINRATETIVRNHPANRALDQQFGMPRPTRAHVFRFVTADVPGKTHKALLLFLLATHTHFGGVDDDDEIAGIDVRREHGFLFSAEQVCRFDRDTAEDLIFGIDQPQLAIDLTGFGGKRLHQRSEKGTETTGRGGHCQPTESSVWSARAVTELFAQSISRAVMRSGQRPSSPKIRSAYVNCS